MPILFMQVQRRKVFPAHLLPGQRPAVWLEGNDVPVPVPVLGGGMYRL